LRGDTGIWAAPRKWIVRQMVRSFFESGDFYTLKAPKMIFTEGEAV
jgi:hypothetical protein